MFLTNKLTVNFPESRSAHRVALSQYRLGFSRLLPQSSPADPKEPRSASPSKTIRIPAKSAASSDGSLLGRPRIVTEILENSSALTPGTWIPRQRRLRSRQAARHRRHSKEGIRRAAATQPEVAGGGLWHNPRAAPEAAIPRFSGIATLSSLLPDRGIEGLQEPPPISTRLEARRDFSESPGA